MVRTGTSLRFLAPTAAMLLLLVSYGWALADPPCTPQAHISTPGLEVDQMWQFFRHEDSAWCRCNKQCAPIDYLAAQVENSALATLDAAKSASGQEQITLDNEANNLFGQRQADVLNFRECLIASRPVYEGSVEVCDTPPAIDKLTDAWAKWCQSFNQQFQAIYSSKFRSAFARKLGRYEIKFYLLALPDGKIQLAPNSTWVRSGMSQAQAQSIIKDITSIKMPDIPPTSSWIKRGGYMWPDYSTMFVDNTKDKDFPSSSGMPCPGTTFTTQTGLTQNIPL